VRQQRRDFQRNPTVYAPGSVMNRPEQVRRLREVVQREFEKEFFSQLAFCELAFDGVVVVAAVLDRVVEDRRKSSGCCWSTASAATVPARIQSNSGLPRRFAASENLRVTSPSRLSQVLGQDLKIDFFAPPRDDSLLGGPPT
jgi:hypothetical protein